MKNIRNLCNGQISYNYPIEFDSEEEKSYKSVNLLNDRESSFNECNPLIDEEYNYFRRQFNSSIEILHDKDNNILVPKNTMNKDSNSNEDIVEISEKNVPADSMNDVKKCSVQIENCEQFIIENSYSSPMFLNNMYCYYKKRLPLFYIEKRYHKIRKADICQVLNSNKLINENTNININENDLPGKNIVIKDMNSNKNNMNKNMKNINKSTYTDTKITNKNNMINSFNVNMNNQEITDNRINNYNFRDGKFIIDLSPYKKEKEVKCQNNSHLLRKRKRSKFDKL